MWLNLCTLLTVATSFTTSEYVFGTINRELNDGVNSFDRNIVFGNENLRVVNEVMGDLEKLENSKSRINFNEVVPPLPSKDVKCLMSSDQYCSDEMLKMKNVLVSMLNNECSNCSHDQRQSAGRVIVSMLTHNPKAWKYFLTRYDGLKKVQRTTI